MSGLKKEPSKFSQFDEEFIIKELWGKRKAGRCADIGARSRRGSNIAALFDDGWYCQFIDRDCHWLVKDFPIKGMKRDYRSYGSVYYGDAEHEIVFSAVTPENVNDLLAPDLDLLSIDVDGNDYYIWEAVKQTPEIVIIETSQTMLEGVQKLNEKLGCSPQKMKELAESKGYKFHAKTGPNLIFVHEAELRTPA